MYPLNDFGASQFICIVIVTIHHNINGTDIHFSYCEMKQKLLLALLALFGIVRYVHGACQSCIMFPVPFVAGQGYRHHSFSRPHTHAPGSSFVPLGILLAKQVIITVNQQIMVNIMASEEQRKDSTAAGAVDSTDEKSDNADMDPVTTVPAPSPPLSAVMVGAIGFYKGWISPLLPPACRFVPTCSQYGVQAIQEFGPGKGSILIAWRLLRCSPIGGKGYDPPKWPPVSYTYSY
jgi:putative membrane protein insertion efficiency factor